MSDVLLVIGGLLLLAGGLLGLLAALGVLRFPDLYTRLHAASKAGTLGAGLVFLGLAAVTAQFSTVLSALVGIVFLVLTTPVSAHLLARAAYMRGIRPVESTESDELALKAEEPPVH